MRDDVTRKQKVGEGRERGQGEKGEGEEGGGERGEEGEKEKTYVWLFGDSVIGTSTRDR